MICPACKSDSNVAAIECEDDEYGDAYTAHQCNGCGWRSDEPPIRVAHDCEGNCESCGLPIRRGELMRRYGDGVAIHDECPKGAVA